MPTTRHLPCARLRDTHAGRVRCAVVGLLGAVIVGLFGMHSLVPASASSVTQGGSGHHQAHPAHEALPPLLDPQTAPHDGVDPATHGAGLGVTAGLCVALLLAFGVGAALARRTTAVRIPRLAALRRCLPLPPPLAPPQRVPRFTVMRC